MSVHRAKRKGGKKEVLEGVLLKQKFAGCHVTFFFNLKQQEMGGFFSQHEISITASKKNGVFYGIKNLHPCFMSQDPKNHLFFLLSLTLA